MFMLVIRSNNLLGKKKNVEIVTSCAFGASSTFSSATHIIPVENDDHRFLLIYFRRKFEN